MPPLTAPTTRDIIDDLVSALEVPGAIDPGLAALVTQQLHNYLLHREAATHTR